MLAAGPPMITRYRIVRGKRPPDEPLPRGVRLDIRKHIHHVLSPEPAMVDALLADPDDDTRAAAFERDYLALLERRFAADPTVFHALAERAHSEDVYLGCSCPTKRQPNVHRCHTVLALGFLARRFPDLDVRLPRR